jgi:hypothetical protein
MRFASVALALTVSVSAVSPKSGVSPAARRAAAGKAAVPVVKAVSASGPFQNAVAQLNGTVVNPAAYPANIDGFNAYLVASGVHDFTGSDFTRPNHPDIARKLGYTNFVPPQQWWDRGAALALLAQGVQRAVGAPINIRNWWRPDDYNRQPGVDGARASDHITANALDLDYASAAQREKAEIFLRSLQAAAPWLNMSLGLGAATTHVGLLSPRGHREWYYTGYTAPKTSRAARRRA